MYVILIYMYVIPHEGLIWEKIKLYSTVLFYIDILLYYKYYYWTIVYMYDLMYCIKCYICAGFFSLCLTTSSVKSSPEPFGDINIQSYQRSVLHVFWGSIFSISQHVLRLDYMRSDLSLSYHRSNRNTSKNTRETSTRYVAIRLKLDSRVLKYTWPFD